MEEIGRSYYKSLFMLKDKEELVDMLLSETEEKTKIKELEKIIEKAKRYMEYETEITDHYIIDLYTILNGGKNE